MRIRLYSPTALLSGAFTFGLLLGHAIVARAVLPHLIELLQTAPRLAMLGFLALITLPGSFTFVVHRFGSRFLDRIGQAGNADKTRLSDSVWAGALVWMVLYSTTILTRLLFLVINPPQPDPDGMMSLGGELASALAQASPSNALSLFAGLWILVASTIFEIEQRTRKPR